MYDFGPKMSFAQMFFDQKTRDLKKLLPTFHLIVNFSNMASPPVQRLD